MFLKKLTFATVAFCFAFTGIVARAQDAGALLDLLVRKKVISDQEAEEVRAELAKEVASTSAGKWKLSTPINEIELYGDARLRYEYRGGRTASNDPQTQMIGMSAIVNVTGCALVFAARYLTIGFLDSDWKPAPVIARRMSRLGGTAAMARFRRTTTASTWARPISVTKASPISR